MADPTILAALSTAAWSSMAGWLTPTSLFLLLNIMIGTILISSRFHSSKDPNHVHHQHHYGQPGPTTLARAPSLVQRVRSFNFSGTHKFDNHPVHSEYIATKLDPPHAPSLIHRLKSINFTPYIFDHSMPVTAPEPEYSPMPDHAPIARAPSLIQRLKSINLSPYQYIHPEPAHPATKDPARAAPPPVAPVPSFLERVKSINFSLYGQEEHDSVADILDKHEDHPVHRVNSDTKPRGGEAPAKLSRKMKKSASDKSAFGHFKSDDEVGELPRRPETAREPGTRKGCDHVPASVDEGPNEIDGMADDFINSFRADLKLQRLDSIVRYKEMITRGAS